MPKIVIGLSDEAAQAKPGGFFALDWDAADIAVCFPEQCPCCGLPATRKRALWTRRVTGMSPLGGAKELHLRFDVPVCQRFVSPTYWFFAGLFVVPLFIVFALITGANALDPRAPVVVPAILTLLLGGASVWLYRQYTWLRFAHFDHRSFTFRARRRAYAEELARLNDGRLGKVSARVS